MRSSTISSAIQRGRDHGRPLDPNTVIGPLVSKEQFDQVKGYLELGKKEGARVTVGGEAGTGKGYFVKPTVFAGREQQHEDRARGNLRPRRRDHSVQG